MPVHKIKSEIIQILIFPVYLHQITGKPYDEGKEKYYTDIYQRLLHGEFSQKDSIHFDEKLKFSVLWPLHNPPFHSPDRSDPNTSVVVYNP